VAEVSLSARDVSLTTEDPSGAGGGTLDLADDTASPEQAVADAEHQAACEGSIRMALTGLSERERAVVHEQFFREDGKSLADVGRALGVSRQRAGQILAGARDKLRARLEAVA